MSLWIWWLIIIIILVLVEVSTVNLVSIWFVISGIISLLLSLIPSLADNYLLQTGIFVIGGVFFMFLTKDFVRGIKMNKKIPTNYDRLFNLEGEVLNDFVGKKGEVKIDGKIWSAHSEQEIKKGDIIKVLAVESTKLKVIKK